MPDPVTGMVVGGSMLGSSVIGGAAQGYAANKASDAEGRAAEMSIAEQRRQFDEIQALLKPYIEGGTAAFGAQHNLIGLGGAQKEAEAIAALQRSPTFTGLVQSGENAILQNASATGGLRGGNVQAALGQFRPNLLSQMIESRFSNLGGIAGLGQASATGQAAAGQNMANAISDALRYQGQSTAQRYLAQGQGVANVAGTLGQIGQTFGGLRLKGKI